MQYKSDNELIFEQYNKNILLNEDYGVNSYGAAMMGGGQHLLSVPRPRIKKTPEEKAVAPTSDDYRPVKIQDAPAIIKGEKEVVSGPSLLQQKPGIDQEPQFTPDMTPEKSIDIANAGSNPEDTLTMKTVCDTICDIGGGVVSGLKYIGIAGAIVGAFYTIIQSGKLLHDLYSQWKRSNSFEELCYRMVGKDPKLQELVKHVNNLYMSDAEKLDLIKRMIDEQDSIPELQ